MVYPVPQREEFVSHPTPPVFDDPPSFPAGVDLNGKRNHDEIRFWADYIGPERRSANQPGNENQIGNPAEDTADFSEPPFGPGNLRADYVLPSKDLAIRRAGVFWPVWPPSFDPLSRLTGSGIFGDPDQQPSSDHRLVWIDASHGAFGTP